MLSVSGSADRHVIQASRTARCVLSMDNCRGHRGRGTCTMRSTFMLSNAAWRPPGASATTAATATDIRHRGNPGDRILRDRSLRQLSLFALDTS